MICKVVVVAVIPVYKMGGSCFVVKHGWKWLSICRVQVVLLFCRVGVVDLQGWGNVVLQGQVL